MTVNNEPIGHGPKELLPKLLKIATEIEYRARIVRGVALSNSFVDQANTVRDALATINWAHIEIMRLREELDEMQKEMKLLTDANDALTQLAQ